MNYPRTVATPDNPAPAAERCRTCYRRADRKRGRFNLGGLCWVCHHEGRPGPRGDEARQRIAGTGQTASPRAKFKHPERTATLKEAVTVEVWHADGRDEVRTLAEGTVVYVCPVKSALATDRALVFGELEDFGRVLVPKGFVELGVG